MAAPAGAAAADRHRPPSQGGGRGGGSEAEPVAAVSPRGGSYSYAASVDADCSPNVPSSHAPEEMVYPWGGGPTAGVPIHPEIRPLSASIHLDLGGGLGGGRGGLEPRQLEPVLRRAAAPHDEPAPVASTSEAGHGGGGGGEDELAPLRASGPVHTTTMRRSSSISFTSQVRSFSCPLALRRVWYWLHFLACRHVLPLISMGFVRPPIEAPALAPFNFSF